MTSDVFVTNPCLNYYDARGDIMGGHGVDQDNPRYKDVVEAAVIAPLYHVWEGSNCRFGGRFYLNTSIQSMGTRYEKGATNTTCSLQQLRSRRSGGGGWRQEIQNYDNATHTHTHRFFPCGILSAAGIVDTFVAYHSCVKQHFNGWLIELIFTN